MSFELVPVFFRDIICMIAPTVHNDGWLNTSKFGSLSLYERLKTSLASAGEQRGVGYVMMHGVLASQRSSKVGTGNPKTPRASRYDIRIPANIADAIAGIRCRCHEKDAKGL